MTRSQPERVIDDATAAFAECGRLFGLLPAATSIRRAEDRRAKMPRTRRREHRLAVALVDNAVMNDVAEKLRPGESPRSPRRFTVQLPQAFFRRDEQRYTAR